MRKILIVEDEAILREAYQMILSTEPFDIDAASNGQEALEKCKKTKYDIILLDLMMPNLDGNGFLEKFVPEDHPNTKVIILSNLSSGAELENAMRLGAHTSLLKSDFSPKELVAAVRYELAAN